MIRNYGMYLAWVVAIIGAFLSLYFGEIKGNAPCRLCWLQRMALFPLLIQLAIAAYRWDLAARIYAYPLSIFGCIVALFQALLPWSHLHKVCGTFSNCENEMSSFFRIIPFPWVSAIGFALITVLLWVSRK